jgi:hypothetical protein
MIGFATRSSAVDDRTWVNARPTRRSWQSGMRAEDARDHDLPPERIALVEFV